MGQGVVPQDGRVIAIEGAEGTDEMLRRIAALIDPVTTHFRQAPEVGSGYTA